MNKLFAWPLFFVALLLFGNCTAGDKVALKPATVLHRDVFTCKGLSKDNRWVGVTDTFLPETDPNVIVVAQLAPEDNDSIITYELINPANAIVLQEKLFYPKEKFVGVYFEMSTLTERGGEGKWKTLVFADGNPIGRYEFYVGEKTLDEEDIDGPSYFVIGEDSVAEEPARTFDSEEERMGSFIKEVTPEVSDLPPTNARGSGNDVLYNSRYNQ